MFIVPLGKEDHEKTFNGDNNNVEDLKSLMDKYPGAIILEGEPHLGKDFTVWKKQKITCAPKMQKKIR